MYNFLYDPGVGLVIVLSRVLRAKHWMGCLRVKVIMKLEAIAKMNFEQNFFSGVTSLRAG